jgi:hypothetical protein
MNNNINFNDNNLTNTDYQNIIHILFTDYNIHISNNNNNDNNDNNDNNNHIKISIYIKYNNIHSIGIIYNNKNHKINKIIDSSSYINNINNSINSIGNNFISKLHTYIETLPPNDLSIINNEYNKYNFDIMGCLIAGISSYFIFAFLNDDSYFSSILHFQIPISSENILNNPMAKLYRNILTPLSKLSTGLIKNLINFIISFLNLSENIFINNITICITTQFDILSDTLSSFLSNIFYIIDSNTSELLDLKLSKLELLDLKLSKLELLEQKLSKLELLEQKLSKLELLDLKLNKLELLEQKLNKLELLEQKLNINSLNNLENRINIIESKFTDMCNNPFKLCKITHCMKMNKI